MISHSGGGGGARGGGGGGGAVVTPKIEYLVLIAYHPCFDVFYCLCGDF